MYHGSALVPSTFLSIFRTFFLALLEVKLVFSFGHFGQHSNQVIFLNGVLRVDKKSMMRPCLN